jgi:autotransporter-associated beta strand protein
LQKTQFHLPNRRNNPDRGFDIVITLMLAPINHMIRRIFIPRSSLAAFFAVALLTALAPRASAQDGFAMVNGTTTGGTGGPVVTVTNGTDFNTQINIAGPRIIQVQGVLSVGRIFTTANKTIIGLGTDATLFGNLNVSDTTNVILRNLRVTGPANDGFTIWNAQHVWIDHCTFYDTGDGLCDINRGSQYVTVSWCKFFYVLQVEHRFTMIADGYINAGVTNFGYYTMHHNWWSTRANERMPASSDGRIHMYNNYFDCTNNSYSSNARNDTQILSVSNYYAGVHSPLYADAGSTGLIRTMGNIYVGTSGNPPAPGTDTLGPDLDPPPYSYVADPAASVPSIVMAGAGAPGPDTMPIPPKIWNGGGSGNNWNTANNWGLGETPKVDDVLIFAGSTRLTPNNNFSANTEYYGINFSNNAGAFVLSGNAINIGGPIVDDSTSVQTISLNMDFGFGQFHYATNRFINVSSPAGSLVINGNISGDTNAYFSRYSLTKQGAGLLTLNGINTFQGTLFLDGGTLRFNTLNTNAPGSLGTGPSITFDGGALQWAANNSSDISIRTIAINSGGATLDVGANSVIFANPIGASSSGALTKTGAGTLTLNGNNTYTGNTTINQGALALGVAGALPNSPQIILSNNAVLDVSGRSDAKLTLASGKTLRGNGSVLGSVTASSGATISPGFSIGALVITNALTLQSGSTVSMEIDASGGTNDIIAGLASVAYGGTLTVANLNGTPAAGQSFKLFDAASYNNSFNTVNLPALAPGLIWTNRLAIDGTIAVISPVNTTPTNMTFNLTGSALHITWPADHTGWRLEAQTNAVEIGLSANWMTVPGSDATNELFLPVDPANGSVFYRLVYP